MLVVLGIYVLIGLLLAAMWSGGSATRHVSGLKAFALVVAAWPVFLAMLFIATRNF